MAQLHRRQQQKHLHIVLMYTLVIFATLSVASGAFVVLTGPKLNEGDPCKHDNYVGKCVKTSECHTLNDYLKKEVLTVHEVPHCNFHVYGEIICCPVTAMNHIEIPDEVRNDAGSETTDNNSDVPTNLSLHAIFQTNVDYVKTEGGINASLNPVLMSASGRNSDIAPATTKNVRSSSTVPGCKETIGELYARSANPCLERKEPWIKDENGFWQVDRIDPGQTAQHNTNGNRKDRNLQIQTTIKNDHFNYNQRITIFKTNQDYIQTNENKYPRPNTVPTENRKPKQKEQNLYNGNTNDNGYVDTVHFKEEPEKMEHYDTCAAKKYTGTCLGVSECQTHVALLDTKLYVDDDIEKCTLGIREEIICCPDKSVVEKALRSNVPIVTTEAPIQHVNVDEDDNRSDTNTVTDTNTDNNIIKKFPYVAAIGFQDDELQSTEYRCAGILLTLDYCVVPSNCLANDPERTPNSIMVGQPSYDYFVDEEDPNEGGQHKTSGDITVYNIINTITETEVSRPACIYNNYKQLPADVNFSVTHWGRDEEDFVKYDLKETPVQIVNKNKCNDNYKNYRVNTSEENFKDAHICVMVENEIAATSNLCALGVSGYGSALNIIYPNGETCVLGLTTPMDNCQHDGPILFTALGYYQDFIHTVETSPEVLEDY